MLTLTSIVLCFSWLVTSSFGASAPFIQKCKVDDKDCLLKSTQAAIPYFAAGVPDIGLRPLDPLPLNTVSSNEQGLEIVFKDMILTGAKNCQVKSVEINENEHWKSFEAECPIEVNGNYVASGKLLGVPVEGEGPFQVKTDKLLLRVMSDVKTITGEDGQKYWNLDTKLESYEFFEKTTVKFENLFNGDEEKARPVNVILEELWKEVLQTFGKPIVNEGITQIDSNLHIFFAAISLSELIL